MYGLQVMLASLQADEAAAQSRLSATESELAAAGADDLLQELANYVPLRPRRRATCGAAVRRYWRRSDELAGGDRANCHEGAAVGDPGGRVRSSAE